MIGSWKIAAQLSTSYSSRDSLDPLRMLETVRRVRQAVDLDLLIVGFRESPEIFSEFCGSRRPVDDTHLWHSALSDIEGMDDSDLVVNWRGERSRGWGGWAEKGGEVEETFRFVCPNNPAVRKKTARRLGELLARYDFAGVFLDKIRFPSPANGVILTLTLSSRSSPIARSTLASRRPKQRAAKPPCGSIRCSPAPRSFRASSAFARTA
jgi:hypothetical protein